MFKNKVLSKYNITAKTSFDDEFELTPELRQNLEKLKLMGDIELLEEGNARLKPKAAAKLSKTYELFTSEKYADERFEEVETGIKSIVQQAIKEEAKGKAKDIELRLIWHIQDKYVVGQGASIVGRIEYDGETEDFDTLYYSGEHEHGDAITSWPEWAFWLLDHDSPLQSDIFTESYEKDQISQGLSELLSYREQNDEIKENAKKAVKKLLG